MSDAHTILLSSSNQIDKPLHAVNSLGLLVIVMLSYRILSASERHCSKHATLFMKIYAKVNPDGNKYVRSPP